MVKVRPAGIPLALLVATSLLALVVVHTIGYAVGHASGDGYARSMTTAQHDAYWPVFVTGVLLLALVAAVTARSKAQFARLPVRGTAKADVRLIVRVWITLAVASLVGFVLLENVEGLVFDKTMVGLAPLALLGRLLALGPVALAITALALGAAAVVLVGRVEYTSVLNRSYEELVADGVFTADFRQSPWAVDFVTRVLGDVLTIRDTGSATRVLECGCGTGVWLEEVSKIASSLPGPVALYAFDLSPDMAAAARVRLDRAGVVAETRQGDILDPASFWFDGDDRFDLVFAYDVVQQLPADLQEAAFDSMLEHVRPGGHLVVFDHDATSRYGRVMGARKWLRRYFDLPTVPRYYIHARYPKLEAAGRRARAAGRDARIIVEPEGRKRALVVAAEGDAGTPIGRTGTTGGADAR